MVFGVETILLLTEMGVFHDLFQPQREANRRTRLDEFTPAGINAGLILAIEGAIMKGDYSRDTVLNAPPRGALSPPIVVQQRPLHGHRARLSAR